MSIPISSGAGALFNTWGKILGGSNEVQNVVNGTLTTRVGLINTQFAASLVPDVPQLSTSNLASLQGQMQNAPQGYETGLNNMLQNTLLEQVNLAYPTVNPLNLRNSVEKLIAQMNVGGYGVGGTIQRPTISVAAVSGNQNVGTGFMVASLTDWDGRPLDYCLAETLTAVCTADGYPNSTPSATAGSEPFTLTGQIAASSIYAYNYPAGSGGSVTVTTLNPGLTSGTIITDGNFEIWSGSPLQLTNWNIGVGVAGTTIKQGTGANVPYVGTYCLQIVGDGSELTKLRQAVTLRPNTVYAVNCWMKTDGAVAAGVLQMRLVSAASATASASTVITNDAGDAQTISQTVSALTSTYTHVQGFFQTPAVLPTTTYFEFYVSTAITSTEVVNIDSLGVVAATQAYPGGPYVGIFPGSVNYAIGDTFAVTVANNSTIGSFSRQLSRFFGLPALDLKIPSASSPSISDALVS